MLREPTCKPAKLPELDARRNQIWRILFRIADLAGGDWPAARAAALELSGGDRRADEASTGIRLLGHIRDVFRRREDDLRQELVEELNADEQSPYGGWNDGKGITTRELGRKLKPYGIRAKPIRIDVSGRRQRVRADQFEDAWSRYLSGSGIKTGTTGTSGFQSQKQAERKPVQDAVVAVVRNGANPHEERDVPVVAALVPEYGDEGLDDEEITQLGLLSLGELRERFE